MGPGPSGTHDRRTHPSPPLRDLTKERRTKLLHEALAGRSPNKTNQIAREDASRVAKEFATAMLYLSPPSWLLAMNQMSGDLGQESGWPGGVNINPSIDSMTARVASFIPVASLQIGVSDLSRATKLICFATPANLAGLPAISFPAGYSTNGLPIGMQAIGRAWEEPLLLRIAQVGEACFNRLPPKWHFRILP